MPWCPKCKNEYKEGIKTCSDCGCELVENEPAEDEELSEAEAALQKMSEAEKAVFMENLKQAVKEAETAEHSAGRPVVPYQNSAAKAEDNKSSAYMLLFFGVIGMIVIILGMTGVLPFHLSGAAKYMAYGIMSALFLLFIVMGLVSMKSYHIFAKKAESENTLRSTIESWCTENLKPEGIDEAVLSEEVAEEEKYFRRTSYMKEKITEKFLNLDEAFLDNLVDEMYTGIYEE